MRMQRILWLTTKLVYLHLKLGDSIPHWRFIVECPIAMKSADKNRIKWCTGTIQIPILF